SRGLFQHAERCAQSGEQLLQAHRGELLLRVVDVVNVYGTEAEVLPALGHAIPQEPRSEAVSTPDEIVSMQHLRVEKLSFQVRLITAARRRRRAIERHITALRADDQF